MDEAKIEKRKLDAGHPNSFFLASIIHAQLRDKRINSAGFTNRFTGRGLRVNVFKSPVRQLGATR